MISTLNNLSIYCPEGSADRVSIELAVRLVIIESLGSDETAIEAVLWDSPSDDERVELGGMELIAWANRQALFESKPDPATLIQDRLTEILSAVDPRVVIMNVFGDPSRRRVSARITAKIEGEINSVRVDAGIEDGDPIVADVNAAEVEEATAACACTAINVLVKEYPQLRDSLAELDFVIKDGGADCVASVH